MSEHKVEKFLYTFTVNKEVEVERSEEQEINGEKVKVTKKVKEKQPINFALRRPNRRLFERADMFYGVQLSEGIRAGLLTKALLLKRYRNDGGALSDADAQYFYELSSKLASLEDDHQRLLVNADKFSDTDRLDKINGIIKQKMTVLQALQSLETVNQALFAHTAETKAQIQLNNWWIVFLAVWDKENKSEFVDFFPGDTYEQKSLQWDIFDENREDWAIEALARFSLLVGLWNAGARSKDDFEQGERDYGSLVEKVTNETKTAQEKDQLIESSPSTGPTGTTEIAAA